LTEPALAALAERVRAADPEALAEALACAEDARPAAAARQRALLALLEPRAPESHWVVGITGPPGAGKSSLAGALGRHWLARGAGVGVVAVDPSSRRSGGALLGDRARLRFDPGARAFVRSLAAREHLGGLAPAARAAALVLRAAFEWTLIETVGVGQSEVEIATLADSVVLVLQPGSGDTLQFMKAGILEIPHVLVVHKWDVGAEAERTRADLEGVLDALGPEDTDWRPPVVAASAHSGAGVAELAEQLERHRAHQLRSGRSAVQRRAARGAWALELLAARYGSSALERLGGRRAAETLCASLPGGALDLYAELCKRAGVAA
jgi:LAO/AO transport system kinase